MVLRRGVVAANVVVVALRGASVLEEFTMTRFQSSKSARGDSGMWCLDGTLAVKHFEKCLSYSNGEVLFQSRQRRGFLSQGV